MTFRAVRALRGTPAFTVGAVATVAMAVGATTAIFSVVYGVLLRQLPYRDVERVFWMWSSRAGGSRGPFDVPDFLDYRAQARALDGLAGFFTYGASLSDDAAGERVQGLRVTGNFFDVLGARAALGRVLQPTDEQPGGDHVVVLTEPFWRQRFAADAGLVGRSIRLNGEPYSVVGVLAPGFATPVREVEFVVPFSPENDPRRGERDSLNFIIGVGRLGNEVSWSQASEDLNAVAKRLRAEYPGPNARKIGVQMIPAITGIVGSARTALLTIFAAVGAVLLGACANLANLMLARASGRRREIAVELALGASRLSVLRQFLAEALMLSAAGGVLGVVIARWGVVLLLTLAPSGLPRAGEVRVDLVVLAFSLAASVATGLLFGVIPALVSARVEVRDALQSGGRGMTAGGGRLRGALVSAEVGLAVALLVTMTLLAKSFANAEAVAPGFDPEGVLAARLTLPPQRFATRESIAQFQKDLSARIAALPGVVRTGTINLPPLVGTISDVPFSVEGRPIDRDRVPMAQFRVASPGYFETMRIPLVRGRTFSDRDTDRTRAVAVVNEALADRWLEGRDPIGARLLVDDSNDAPARPVEIVGVVGNVRQLALDDDAPTWDLYLTYPQINPDTTSLAAANLFWLTRTASEPGASVPAFSREVRRVDPDVVASEVRPLRQALSTSVAPRRFSVTLVAAFGLSALLLAVTGIYAVVTYAISQRAREIGIRLALGARRSDILRLVVGQGAAHIAVGLAAGLVLAGGMARLLASMLFGLRAEDPATFLQVAIAVASASLFASAMPTLRAFRLGAHISPTE